MTARFDNARLSHFCKMLRKCGLRYIDLVGQLLDALLTLGQRHHDLQSLRVGADIEHLTASLEIHRVLAQCRIFHIHAPSQISTASIVPFGGVSVCSKVQDGSCWAIQLRLPVRIVSVLTHMDFRK